MKYIGGTDWAYIFEKKKSVCVRCFTPENGNLWKTLIIKSKTFGLFPILTKYLCSKKKYHYRWRWYLVCDRPINCLRCTIASWALEQKGRENIFLHLQLARNVHCTCLEMVHFGHKRLSQGRVKTCRQSGWAGDTCIQIGSKRDLGTMLLTPCVFTWTIVV